MFVDSSKISKVENDFDASYKLSTHSLIVVYDVNSLTDCGARRKIPSIQSQSQPSIKVVTYGRNHGNELNECPQVITDDNNMDTKMRIAWLVAWHANNFHARLYNNAVQWKSYTTVLT